MSTTLTLNLPDDAIVSQVYDPLTNFTHYNLTIPKTDIPFLVRFLLNGIPSQEKEQTPLKNKEIIARAAGLKYVYRLPSIMRTLMIGTACGIALKTLAENNNPKNILDLAAHSQGPATFGIKFSSKLCARAIDCINLHPYISALSMTGASLITTQASNETAYAISYILEGAISLGKSGVKTIESGCVKTAALVKRYGNFCRNQPKTGAAVTSLIPLGIALWIKSADIKNMYGEALKIGANAAGNIMKNFRK